MGPQQIPLNPQVGQSHTFDDGETATWDGHGWAVEGPATGHEAGDMIRSAAGNTELMSMLGGLGAGMLAAPLTAGASIPMAVGIEGLSGALGGSLGAAAARSTRSATGQENENSLLDDMAMGGAEGVLGNTAGSLVKGVGSGLGYLGKATSPWGRRALGAAVGTMGGFGAGTAIGAGMGETVLNPRLLPAALTGVGETLRPSSFRGGLDNIIEFMRSGSKGGAPAATPPPTPPVAMEAPIDAGVDGLRRSMGARRSLGATDISHDTQIASDPMSQARFARGMGQSSDEAYREAHGMAPGQFMTDADYRGVKILDKYGPPEPPPPTKTMSPKGWTAEVRPDLMWDKTAVTVPPPVPKPVTIAPTSAMPMNRFGVPPGLEDIAPGDLADMAKKGMFKPENTKQLEQVLKGLRAIQPKPPV